MKEYLFYTTEGTTLPRDTSKDIENCQILGRSNGENPEVALTNLLKENKWITEVGFDIFNISAVQILNDKLRQDLKLLTNCLLEEINSSKTLKYSEAINNIVRQIQLLL